MKADADGLFKSFARFMVEENYYGLAQNLKENELKKAGVEDGRQLGVFLIHCRDIGSSGIENFIEDEINLKETSSEYDLRNHILELSRTHDGAVIYDKKQVSNYVVLDGLQKAAKEAFNKRYDADFKYFSELLPFFMPKTFSHHSEGIIKAGSKTKTALATSLVLNDVIVYLLKYTVFGSTGTGKFIRMRNEKNCFYYDEFFLYKEDDLNHEDALKNTIKNEHYFDLEKRVVGMHQHYEADTSRIPELNLVERKLIRPEEIGIIVL